MVKGYIYRHWIVNDECIEKSYIGKTIREPIKRWQSDGKGYLEKDTKFSRAINKYGWDNFHHDILLEIEHENIDELNKILSEYEKMYINEYDSFYNGYNSTLGGDGSLGFHPQPRTKEWKEKQSNAHKGKTQSEITKQKISNSVKGKHNHFYGKTHSEETKKKMSENHYDCKGGKNPFAKGVVCKNNGMYFPSAADGARWCGLKDSSSISKCCNNKQKYAGKHPETKEKLTWEFSN